MRFILLLVLLLSVVSTAAVAETPLQRCQMHVLDELGVHVTSGSDRQDLNTSEICNSTGTQTIEVSWPQDEKAMAELFNHNAIKCAYKLKMEKAALIVATKLNANKNYHFGSCEYTYASAPYDKWTPHRRCIIAKDSPTEALNCFFNEECQSECGVGQQVAQLTTLAQLFGEADFERTFNRDEIALGAWSDLLRTYNPFSDREESTHPLHTIKDPSAQETAKQGRLFLVGASGYLGSTGREWALDSPNDRGENFFILSASAEAAAALAQKSFTHYDKINQQAQALLLKYLQTGAAEEPPVTQARAIQLFRTNKDFISELERLLNDPVYDGITVFVHPLGIMTLGDHVRRLLQLNPRTTYEFSLYNNNMNTLHYDRYIQSKMSACMEEREKIPQIKIGSKVIDSQNREGEVTHLLADGHAKILLAKTKSYLLTTQSTLGLVVPEQTVTIQGESKRITAGTKLLLYREMILSVTAVTANGKIVGNLDSGRMVTIDASYILQVLE